MNITYMTLDDCHKARGVVVVIDVLRAFTTAAYAIAAGADEIILVREVEEALAMRACQPDSLVMGEVRGFKPQQFDYGNSPADLLGLNLEGRRLIQRTSAGTQGVVRSSGADSLWAASFVCAQATVESIARLKPQAVTFVITGMNENRDGDEDIACADYMTALLGGERPDARPFLKRVNRSFAGRLFTGAPGDDFAREDLELALQVNRFNFAMPIERRVDLLVLHRQPVP